MVFSGGDQRRASAIALHARDDRRKIVGLDDKDKFLDHLDAAPVIAGDFRPPYAAGTEQKFLDRPRADRPPGTAAWRAFQSGLAGRAGPCGVRKASRSRRSRALAQFIKRGNAEFLVDTHARVWDRAGDAH